MAVQDKRPYEEDRPGLRVLRLVLPPIAAILFDVVAMLFVVIMTTYFPERGNPRLATSVQQQITAQFLEILTQVFNAISAQEFRAITGDKKMTVEQVIGYLIIRYFYEPAVTALTAALSAKSPLYGHNNASKLTWPQLENLLTVYRFTREIGESVDLGTNHIKLEPRSVAHLRKLLVQCAQLGIPDVHVQLCRLLYNSNIKLEERRTKIQNNPRDLSLYHYLGSSEVDQLIADIRRELRRPKPQSRKVDLAAETRKRNLTLVIDPYAQPDIGSRMGSRGASRGLSRASAGKIPQPSRFD
jgi:hypothetical protein